jgi:probable rRNA maturation factor
MGVSNFCTITNKTKGRLPSLPFVSIKNKILGKKYDLSISFISTQKQKKINSNYRGINKTTNILSFPISKTSGEITFDLTEVKKEAPLFKMTYPKFLKFLVIHGCLHLKGFQHSSTMEKEEKRYAKELHLWY